ncbi:MAG: MFS transporter [Solirubrobacteraceae bacterium]
MNKGAVKRDRWSVIAAYALVAAANQLLWVTFTPLTTPAAHAYGVSASDIGWLAEIFPLLYVLLAVPAASLLDRWFRPSLVVGALLSSAGGALRVVEGTFALVMAGQVLVALGQPLVLNAITGLASAYLKPASRPAGIAVGSAGIFLGMLVSLVLGSALGGAQIHTILMLGALLSLLPTLYLLTVLAVGEHPPMVGNLTGRDGLTVVWRDLVIRRLAMVAFVGFGLFVALTTWLQTLLKPGGVSASTSGWLLVGAMTTGVLAAALLPPPVIRTRTSSRMFLIAAGGAAGAFVLLATWPSAAPAAIACGVIGFLLLSALPVLLEVSEHRAGSAGTSATALIWLSGNAGAIVIAVLVQIFESQPTLAFLIMAAIALLGMMVVPRGVLHQVSGAGAGGGLVKSDTGPGEEPALIAG